MAFQPVFAADAAEPLPIGLTDEEMLRLDEIGQNHIRTAAPTGEIRNPAEWEPSEGVIIRWPLGISVALVAEMSEDLMVTTIVANSSEETSARNSFTSGGVNMANMQFIHAPTNSIWTRDYGPWFIFEDQQLAISDHIYNRPRPLDDLIPGVIGAEWGLTVYGLDLITAGGNYMSDGLGRAMSTELVYNENPGKTEAEVDSLIQAYLGNDYMVLDYIESGGIHHIDCWAKFLSPGTIMVKDVPTSSSSYALLNARADFLAQQTSAWGQPYHIVRMYCPYGTAYTNSIILNDKVLVPLFGSYYDSTALQTYRDAMPGYEVLGFTGSFLDDDAIHCRSMGVPDRGMLRVRHIPLAGEVGDGGSDYEISVLVEACSGSALIDDSLKVFYRLDGGTWDEAMLAATVRPDSFCGYIPAQITGTVVDYYVQAGDESGRVETHPYIGSPWAHQFEAGGPHAPTAPLLIAPGDTASGPVYDMLTTLVWHPAADPDAGDTCTYTVLLERWEDGGFVLDSEFPLLGDTALTLTDSVEFSTLYRWYVTATDESDLTAVSEPEMFWTWTLGDVDATHTTDVGDLTGLIDFLFVSFTPILPEKVADVTGDCSIDVGDLTRMIDHLFITFGDMAVGCE